MSLRCALGSAMAGTFIHACWASSEVREVADVRGHVKVAVRSRCHATDNTVGDIGAAGDTPEEGAVHEGVFLAIDAAPLGPSAAASPAPEEAGVEKASVRNHAFDKETSQTRRLLSSQFLHFR
eukprot:TRINITY_DN67991_c0_g1_i1.p1 TRINITY_DN67991_c0_g1~~TRINITY_DN67991_c0_g1_i1.p1  ORF type:complete len:123 (-),score=18.55 TRINITY_DN67991_c0_g1_i1:116-484(-)